MPVTVQEQGESNRFTGTTTICPEYRLSDKTFEGKDGMPDALQILCRVKDTEDSVSLFVPIHENAIYKLQPFMGSLDTVPTTESALRHLIEQNFPNREFLVYVQNGSVRAVVAGPGKHLAQLHRVFTYENEKKEMRTRLILRTKEHAEITWTAPWEGAISVDAATKAVNIVTGKHLIQYLLALGLDMEKFVKEMQEAENEDKLFPYFDPAGVTVSGFFPGDASQDVCRVLNDAMERHGKQWVQVEIVDNKKWGPGPKGMGTKDGVELARVIVTGEDPRQKEFSHEAERFMKNYENLTMALYARADVRFVIGGQFTAEGKTAAMGVIKPVVDRWPDVVTSKKADGSGAPAIIIPPRFDAWKLNGVVCLNLVAERLMAAGAKDDALLFDLVNLSNPQPDKLLAWVEEHVKEITGSMDDGENMEELL